MDNSLTFKRLGIDTQQENVVYMRHDCHICLSEGFQALTRVRVHLGAKTIVASLNIVKDHLLEIGEVSLSEGATKSLGVKNGDLITVSHLNAIDSLSFVRSKIYGNTLNEKELDTIIKDIVAGVYSNIHLSAFVTVCADENMNNDEIVYLTKAMINTGQKITWDKEMIVDKHCIGGLPGNRTTPIVVSIVSAFGLTMPKTSSRAITSPAGTADTLEVITDVNLSIDKIKAVVEKEGGCVAWGGTAQLSPADDILIRVERALDIDSEGQLIASVLSKKVAAGSSHVVIDMPVGKTAKLRSNESANKLKKKMLLVGEAIGLKLKVIISDGSQPIGRGIGPALEARDVLQVLRNDENAPKDLKERALLLAGELLELSGEVKIGDGNVTAREILESGKAYEKFERICKAQGRFEEPKTAQFQHEIKAEVSGTVVAIDNRRLANIAKLAGAPEYKLSGVDFLTSIGMQVEAGQTLYIIHAESEGELKYSIEYQQSHKNLITIK